MSILSTNHTLDPLSAARTLPAGDLSIDTLLALAAQLSASDIHLKVGRPPAFRINGELSSKGSHEPLGAEDMARLFEQVTTPEQRDRFQQTPELDLSYEDRGFGRCRVNIARQRASVTMVIRRFAPVVPGVEELNLPAICKELVMRRRGLILITGARGSGKSTTLASMVDYRNEREACRIITCEDPIEYVLEDKRGIITQREVGIDTPSYISALDRVARQDSDVILLGEIRGTEVLGAVLAAAETGHLILSTLRASNAAMAVDRIIDAFPPHHQQQVRIQVAENLVGVLCQCLLPRLDGMGRVPAVEVMVATSAVRNLIREGKTHQIPGVIETGQRLGMRTMDQALADLCRRNIISIEHALTKANNPEHLRSLVTGI